MNHKNKSLYFILLLMKEITSALCGTSLLQYDITKALDRWFSKVMNFNTDSATSGVLRALQEAEKYHLQDFEYDLEQKVEPFPTKLFFHDVVFCMTQYYQYLKVRFTEIDWNLRTNEVSALAKLKGTAEFQLIPMSIKGYVNLTKDTQLCLFKSKLWFRELKLHTAALSKSNMSMDISYDYSRVYDFEAPDAQWWHNDTLQRIAKYFLLPKLEPAFVAMLKEVINRHNTLFQSVFESIFNISKQANQEVISTKADMFQKGRKYYYLIPNVPFCCGFSLKTVVIKGLTNIKSLKFYQDPSPFSHSFSMDNVQGSMVLDYERVEEKPLQLDFKIDRLSMSIVHANNCVIIEAPVFSVNSTSGPITHRQSAVLVQYIESAIVSSLMPSRQVCDVPNDEKVPVTVELGITKASNHWNKIKEICLDWIPFNI